MAERITNPVAEFSGLDKITGRITTFDVYINETVQFGALQVTPKVCYSRTENEAPRTDGFVEVEEITLDRKIRRRGSSKEKIRETAGKRAGWNRTLLNSCR